MSKKKEVVSKYPYPSRFGSHESMVIRQEGDVIICKDEFGEYSTNKSNMDSGLIDSNRTSQARLTKLFSGTKREDPKAGRR